jgi:ribosomal protein S18 acetylase RimI-like enzyme
MPTLRPATPEDEPFLRALYLSTRSGELAAFWALGEAQRDALFRMQFTAQQRGYAAEYPGADHHLILRDGAPVGRLYVDRRAGEICLVDIALLPEHRGAGIGGALLRALLDEAAASGSAVCLHVLETNPALRLYERLGYTRTGGDGLRHAMAWRPPPPDPRTSPCL